MYLVGTTLFEIDPVTKVDISAGGSAPPSILQSGIGGTNTRLYYSDQNTERLHEVDPNTLAKLSGAGVNPGLGGNGHDIGGTSTQLFHTNTKLYEIDPNTLANLSGAGVTAPNTIIGMGGMKNA